MPNTPFQVEEVSVEVGVERGELVKERAAPLQPSDKEGRQGRVQKDALVQRLAERQP